MSQALYFCPADTGCQQLLQEDRHLHAVPRNLRVKLKRVTAVEFFDESYLRWVDSLQRRQPSFGSSFVQTFGSVEISEVILGAPAVLFVTKMEISDEQVNICGACSRDSLELLSVSQLKLPGAKRRWCIVVVGNANHWRRRIPRVGTRRRAVATEWMIYWATR